MSNPHWLIDGVWVDMLYPSADESHATGWFIEEKAEGSPSPSGDLRASISIACDRNLQASWTQPNKPVRIYSHAGGQIWGGVTTEPSRDDGRITIHAEGYGSLLAHWDAVQDTDPSASVVEAPTFIPNDAVDYAILSGAPFTRNGVDLGTAAMQADNDGPLTDILTLLTRSAIEQGKRVYVDSRGEITMRSNPTTPTWVMTPQPDYFGTTDEQYVSLLRGYFLDIDKYALIFEWVGGPTGGTTSFSLDGVHYTSALVFNVANSTLQAALRTLGGILETTVVSTLSTSPNRRVLVSLRGPGTLFVDDLLTGGTDSALTINKTVGRGLVKAEDTAAAAKFGVRQAHIDLTNLDPIDESVAQAYITGRFALVGARMGWTTQVVLNSNNLLHSSGVFANPRYVKAGQMLLIPGIIDARSNPTIRGSIQWVIQEVTVNENGPGPIATVTPVGFVARDFSGLLAPPEKPADTKAA